MMKNKRRQKEQAVLIGALMASATLGARPALASQAVAGHKPRYEDMIADVLRTARWEQRSSESQAPATQPFDIPPGPLQLVLKAFETQTRIAVTSTRAGIYDLHSPGVSGLYSPEQALNQLLTGTGVTFRFTSASSVSLDLRAQAEFVEVTGAPARVVSSPKFTADVRDIPQTITVIPNEVIQSQGATTLRDVLRNVTGISIQAGEGGPGR